MELKTKEYDDFRSLVYAKSGITLGEGKEALVSSRIGKRMRALGIGRFGEYLEWVQEKGGQEEMVHMLDAISTNVTSFFRESAHFDFLRGRLAEWRKAGQRRFRFWSAACSSGEEPYTLAMILADCGLLQDGDVRILATDLSTRILAAATAGVYAQSKLDGIPEDFVRLYLEKADDAGAGMYRMRAQLRDIISFSRMNLAFPPFPMQGPMDAIFVRNVMIYFDNDVRRKLVNDCARLLKPGGILMIGHSESINGLGTAFKCIRPSIYEKQGA